MDNKPHNSMILPKRWAVALWLSRFLCQADREAVLGDLTESGESGGGAIANILGLVVRRWMTDLFDMQVWFAVGFFCQSAICFPRLRRIRLALVRFIRGCT